MATIKVAKFSDLKSASLTVVAVGEHTIVLIKNESGEVRALEDCCSHAEVALSGGTLEGNEIECPAHGARFDITTGKPLCLPATRPVRVFETKVVDNDVIVVVPDVA